MNKKWAIGYIILSIIFFNVSGQYVDEENEEDEDAEESDVNPAASSTTVNSTLIEIQANATRNATNAHVLGQVNNILANTENLNITGIVDSALGIRNSPPVRKLVNTIIEAVFCNQFLASYNNCGHREVKNPTITT